MFCGVRLNTEPETPYKEYPELSRLLWGNNSSFNLVKGAILGLPCFFPNRPIHTNSAIHLPNHVVAAIL